MKTFILLGQSQIHFSHQVLSTHVLFPQALSSAFCMSESEPETKLSLGLVPWGRRHTPLAGVAFLMATPGCFIGCLMFHMQNNQMILMGFPGGLDGKESACNVGDLGLISGSGRSLGEGEAIHISCVQPSFPF